MRNISKIEQQVMASVAVIYSVRHATSPFMLKLYAVVLSAAGIVAFVSISHVASNFVAVMQGGLPSIANYTTTAVLHTTLIVQLALVVGIAALISMMLDIARQPSRQFSPFVVG